MDDYYVPGPTLSVIKIVSDLKEFAHRQSKMHCHPGQMAQSVYAMGETGSQGWSEESMKGKTGREGLSPRVDVFMQRNKHEPRRRNSDVLGVVKQ